jgi:hypothetical protein
MSVNRSWIGFDLVDCALVATGQLKSRAAVGGGKRAIALAREDAVGHIQERAVILDHKHGFGAAEVACRDRPHGGAANPASARAASMASPRARVPTIATAIRHWPPTAAEAARSTYAGVSERGYAVREPSRCSDWPAKGARPRDSETITSSTHMKHKGTLVMPGRPRTAQPSRRSSQYNASGVVLAVAIRTPRRKMSNE